MVKVRKIIYLFALLLFAGAICADPLPPMTIARLKYGGGGDWYSNPGSLGNLMRYIEGSTRIKMADRQSVVEPGSPELFSYSYLYMNGHGNVFFNEQETRRMRHYLENGGFLHADDNYGMDHSFRREMKKIFPDKDWVELPFDHPIYHQVFSFPDGLPKVHEHDGKPPQGLGLFHQGRLVVFYTYECDLGDGWEDEEVHNNPWHIREAALQMGVNIFIYHLNQ